MIAAAACAAGAMLLSLAAPARGEHCGYYVLIGNPSAAAKAHAQTARQRAAVMFLPAHAATHLRESRSHEAPPIRTPCDGPSCRGRAPTPAPATPTVTPPAPQQLAIVRDDDAAFADPSRGANTSENAFISMSDPLPDDPPPRS